jgi:6,7-dimethyl-8-ribityllumazine synthase
MARKGPRSVLIIEARFYEDIADELARGAIDELDSHNMAYERLAVPGSIEIALALSLALANGFVGRAGRHRGCIALGCVIRGETTHYDIVARESAAGLHQLAVQHAVPIGFGIITCENREQAWERASVDGRNKGGDAARACLTLMQLEQHFSSASRRSRHDRGPQRETAQFFGSQPHRAQRRQARRRAGALPNGHDRHRPKRGDRRV